MRGKILLILVIGLLLITGCSNKPINTKVNSYEDIIKNQYSNSSPKIDFDKILWEEVINQKETIILYLNKDKDLAHAISLARIANIDNEWKARVSIPPERIGEDPISWTWSLLSNPPIEDNPEIASVMWGYIYSPEVAKVNVGSYSDEDSFKKTQIIEFEDYNIKLFYFLSDDKTGFKQDTVIAYNDLGDVLFSNRSY